MTPEPPAFKSITELVTWMIALSFLALLGFVTKKLMSVDTRETPQPAPPPSPDRQHLEACHGVSSDGISDSLAKVIARQDARFDRLESKWDDAVDHVSQMHDWIDDGCPDPPGRPTRPGWAPTHRIPR